MTPPGAFRRLTRTESTLFLREPAAVFWALAFPPLLLVVLGSLPSSRRPDPDFGGLRFVDVYVPVLVAFVVAMLALNVLPPVLAAYREKGVLRRLATTPVSPALVLAAQLAVYTAVAAVATLLVLLVGRLGFGVRLPGCVPGFVLAVALGAGALFALGLLVAAVAPDGRMANGAGAILFFPMMFLAGLWLPREVMPAALRHVSDASPLGATVAALRDSSAGHWPHLWQLGVMVAYALVFGGAAVRLFRWE